LKKKREEIQRYPFLFTFNRDQEINTTTIRERLSRIPHRLYSPHRTDFYMIFLFTEGSGQYMVDFNRIPIEKGHMLFVSKDQVHAFDPGGNYDGLSIIFTESFYYKSTRDQLYLQQSQLFNGQHGVAYINVLPDYERLKEYFNEVAKELHKPLDEFQGELLHNYLHNILLTAERHERNRFELIRGNAKSRQLVVNFKKLIEKNFKKTHSVNFYAQLLNISIRSLQNSTAELIGKTPKQIINDRILLEAKRMLAYNNLTVKEIAFLLGFDEVTNFIKFFKSKSGLTPILFRNSIF